MLVTRESPHVINLPPGTDATIESLSGVPIAGLAHAATA